MLQPFLKRLSDAGIPICCSSTKFDKAKGSLRTLLAILQQVSERPLLLRQIPIWEQGGATGFVDLALERAFVYRPHSHSEVVDIADVRREKEARFQMLERLADYDEHLMEELLGDVEPSATEVFSDLARELAEGLLVPVLIGSAELDNGIERLLKALRHEVPQVTAVAKRLALKPGPETVVQVLKTFHSSHGGKLSLVRMLRGSLKDGAVLHGDDGREARIGGILSLSGDRQTKRNGAGEGDTVALARLEHFRTGETLSTAKTGAGRHTIEALPPIYRFTIETADRKDEVKVTAAIAKLIEEGPFAVVRAECRNPGDDAAGQGEIHLKVAVEKLQSKYGLKLSTRQPRVPYRETIRRGVSARGRHKRQSGGHGQFGDVALEIAPLPRGSGFVFQDRIKGGVVPKQWIGSVGERRAGLYENRAAGFSGGRCRGGADRRVISHGGYPPTPAFQTAGRIAMSEGMPDCSPVLLEPVMKVFIHVPNDATSKVNGLVSSRRGAPLGFDARAGWPGWDTVAAEMPLSEVSDLIVDLRSLTQGVGTYEMLFDRLAN